MSGNAISIVLLLGSYDKQTKSILNSIREEIAKQFSGKPFAFLLANSEIYITERFQVLTEIEENKRLTIYLFEENSLYDVYDLPLANVQDPQQVVFDFLSRKFDIIKIRKESVMQKFEWLMTLSKAIFIIREKSLTRGGEYVELMHALYIMQGDKIWFFKRNSINISSMLMEYVDAFEVKLRFYSKQDDLIASVIRLIGYLNQK